MITTNSNFASAKPTNLSFKGFCRLGSVNKIKNGASEAIDSFVLNTDNIAEITPLRDKCGARIITKTNEIIEIDDELRSFSDILSELGTAVRYGCNWIV